MGIMYVAAEGGFYSVCTLRQTGHLKLCPFCVMISGHRLDARALTGLNFIKETSSGAEVENCHSEFSVLRTGGFSAKRDL